MRECERFKTAAQLFAEEKSDDERCFIVHMFMMHILLLMNALPFTWSCSHEVHALHVIRGHISPSLSPWTRKNMTLKDAIEATSDFSSDSFHNIKDGGQRLWEA